MQIPQCELAMRLASDPLPLPFDLPFFPKPLSLFFDYPEPSEAYLF